MGKVVYVTGNPRKAANFSRFMNLEISHHEAELDEIQTLDSQELVRHKLEQAYAQLSTSVLVEDVAFSFDAWGELPGPFVKFFVKNNAGDGVLEMCRMLDGFENRRATARCTYGYFDGADMRFFEGKVRGVVADMPRGEGGYGFDKLFEPDNFNGKTAAELNANEYETYYTTLKPFAEVRQFLRNKEAA